MWGRRVGYLVSLIGCLVLYIYYTQWAVWVLLWWLIALPIFSLLLSLPAMCTAEFSMKAPKRVTQGQKFSVELTAQCRFPVMPFHYRLEVRNCITGAVTKKAETVHCGTREITPRGLRIYDYLGLFSHRVKNVPTALMVVEPVPVEGTQLPDPDHSAGSYTPKRGGGFSEDHELREYLPGDDLRQIHWKLTAKTGKTVVRQPMEQRRGHCTLAFVLRGTEAELDRLLGYLLWVSKTLLKNGRQHQVVVLSGRGLEDFEVTDRSSLKTMVDGILSAPQAGPEAFLPELDGRVYRVEEMP